MKLYKNTLIISIVILVICVLLSVVFNFTCLSEIGFISFISDYMIGTACSIIVVIVTTFLQFKYEQRKTLNSILSDIQFFFFHYLLVVMSLDPRRKHQISFGSITTTKHTKEFVKSQPTFHVSSGFPKRRLKQLPIYTRQSFR